MLKVVDNRVFPGSISFQDIEEGKPFCFLSHPSEIYVVVNDTTTAELTDNFSSLDTDCFDEDEECQYVDVTIEIA